MDDTRLFDLMKSELFTAVVGDVLDELGYQHQFLPPGIMPLEKHMRVVGRAMTVLEADVFSASDGSVGPLAQKPFGLLFEALDDLKEERDLHRDRLVAALCALGRVDVDARDPSQGRRGVLDGYVRDANEIEALGFTVFCRGTYAQDQAPRGKVIDYRMPIEIDGIRDRDRRPSLRRPRRRARHSARGRAGGGRAGARKSAHREPGRAGHPQRHEHAEAFDTFGVM